MEASRLINSAILNSFIKNDDSAIEVEDLSKSPVNEAISLAINHLSEEHNITRDVAARWITNHFLDLNRVWTSGIIKIGLNTVEDEGLGEKSPWL